MKNTLGVFIFTIILPILSACSGQPEPTITQSVYSETTQSTEQPEEQLVTVAEILKYPADFNKANLQGEVFEHINGDKFRFRDETGEIQLEIDSNVSTDPPMNWLVIVGGDVETDDGVVQIDVRSLEITL